MFHRALIATAAVSAGMMASTVLADSRPIVQTRIPIGRGSFILTQLPPAPQAVVAPYALTGQPGSFTHVTLRLGIRGQTTPVIVSGPTMPPE
jgi:hypothetical protein